MIDVLLKYYPTIYAPILTMKMKEAQLSQPALPMKVAMKVALLFPVAPRGGVELATSLYTVSQRLQQGMETHKTDKDLNKTLRLAAINP